MLDLITINEGKKNFSSSAEWNVILQPRGKKINGKVYGFVMAWLNVISKNADRTRATKNCFENYYGGERVSENVDCMFCWSENDKCKLIA